MSVSGKKVIIDDALIHHLGRLTKLEVTPAQMPAYKAKLQTIVDYMDDLDNCDLSGVPTDAGSEMTPNDEIVSKENSSPSLTSHTKLQRPSNRLRNDVICKKYTDLNIEEFLVQAPTATGTSFQVPKIIE